MRFSQLITGFNPSLTKMSSCCCRMFLWLGVGQECNTFIDNLNLLPSFFHLVEHIYPFPHRMHKRMRKAIRKTLPYHRGGKGKEMMQDSEPQIRSNKSLTFIAITFSHACKNWIAAEAPILSCRDRQPWHCWRQAGPQSWYGSVKQMEMWGDERIKSTSRLT